MQSIVVRVRSYFLNASRYLGLLLALIYWCSTAVSNETKPFLYDTARDVLKALKNDDSVRFDKHEGWIIATQQTTDSTIIWSFTPANHYAYPSVAKRTIREIDSAIFIELDVLCHASKPDCDRLVADFEELNNEIKQSFSEHQ